MATVDKLPMLAEGYEKLQNDVRHLKTVERPAIIDAIEERAAMAIFRRMPNIMPPRSARARSNRRSPISRTGSAGRW